jgi:hypothetical protein
MVPSPGQFLKKATPDLSESQCLQWALKPIYIHEIFLHLEAAKIAVANQKNN